MKGDPMSNEQRVTYRWFWIGTLLGIAAAVLGVAGQREIAVYLVIGAFPALLWGMWRMLKRLSELKKQ